MAEVLLLPRTTQASCVQKASAVLLRSDDGDASAQWMAHRSLEASCKHRRPRHEEEERCCCSTAAGASPLAASCAGLTGCVAVQEAEALQAEVKLMQAETGQLRRDNELRAEVEAQCARRGAAQV